MIKIAFPSFLKFLDPFKKFFVRGKYEKELQELLSQISTNPQDLRLKVKLGELRFKRREIPLGIQAFREVAESYVEEGFILKAVAIYKNIIRFAPGAVEFNEKLASVYHQLGMTKDAINQYLIVINYFQNHGEKERVLEAAKKMVAVDPAEIQNRMRLAEIYYNQGFQEAALEEYEKIGNELKVKGGKQISLLIGVLENIFFRRPKDLHLLKEICILHLKNHAPQAVIRKIEKHKLIEDPDFKKIFDKAREMEEYDQQKKGS